MTNLLTRNKAHRDAPSSTVGGLQQTPYSDAYTFDEGTFKFVSSTTPTWPRSGA